MIQRDVVPRRPGMLVQLACVAAMICAAAAHAGCPEDTNDSGGVDIDDVINVILDWGTDGTNHRGDVNASGLVDVDDVVAVVLAFGLCAPVDGCEDGEPCPAGHYCQRAIGECDGPGTCTPFGKGGCGGQWDPVCGCDGQTYSNAGCAIAAGANVAFMGECGGE